MHEQDIRPHALLDRYCFTQGVPTHEQIVSLKLFNHLRLYLLGVCRWNFGPGKIGLGTKISVGKIGLGTKISVGKSGHPDHFFW